MADPVDNISISVEASAKEATDALNQTSKALDGVGESSEKAGKKVKTSAEQLSLLARQAKAAGLKDLANEFSNMSQKVAQADLADFKKNIAAVAKSLADSGKTDFAERISEIYEAPIEANKELKKVSDDLAEVNRDIAQQEKDKAAAAKQAARDKAAAERKAAREAESAQKKAAREEEAEKKRVAKEVEKAAERKKRAEEKAAEATRRAIAKQQAQLQSLYAKRDKMDFAGVDKDSSKYQSLIYDIAEMEKKMGVESTAAPVQGFAKIKKELHGLGEAAKKTTSKFSKFMASVGRIAMYRAIRTALKAVTQALREGLSNLYTYSQQFGTAFAPAVDNLRQHVMLLKNSIATALRPVLEALMPVVIQLVDWFSKLADFLAQVFSVLFGKTDENGRYTKAVLGDLQESNEEAKELRRTLLGFDEINRLDGDTGGKKDNTALSTQFVQADVSEQAKGIAQWLKSIDWEQIASFLVPLAGILGILKIANLPGVKSILKMVGSFAKAHPILTAIIALLAVAALWGDKISEKIAEVRTKVEEFFDKLSNTQSQFANSVARLIKGILSTVMDVIGTIFRLIYKLTHGDMEGALQDLVHLLAVIITGIVNFIIDVVNIVLGLISDLINGIVTLAVWMWNEGIQPVLNIIIKFVWNNVIVPIQNGLVDLLTGFLKMIQDTWNSIARFLNEKLNWVIEKLNGAIAWINDILGWNIPSIPLDVIPEISDEAIQNIENTKFEPITEDVIPDIKPPDPIDLTIKGRLDASDVEKKLNKLFGTLKQNVSTASAAMTSVMTGQNVKNTPNVSFAQFASGGWPTAGSMFIAGENGVPEVVGSFGGQTGVMNSEQLSAALYNAFTAALAANPQGGDIYLDGEVIYRNTVRRNNNAVRSTGRSALLT